jgi:hypothetical protein
MPTIVMPSKSKVLDATTDATQNRAGLERYRLQVDRQTKASFPSFEAAVKVGIAIKKAHPVVQVIIHDGQESSTKVIG